MSEPLLRVVNLEKKFPIQRGLLKRTVGRIHAVDGISFDIAAGETLGLVGESGCGKSTTARLILRLLDPTAGEIYFNGKEIHTLSREEIRKERKEFHIPKQDRERSLYGSEFEIQLRNKLKLPQITGRFGLLLRGLWI